MSLRKVSTDELDRSTPSLCHVCLHFREDLPRNFIWDDMSFASW